MKVETIDIYKEIDWNKPQLLIATGRVIVLSVGAHSKDYFSGILLKEEGAKLMNGISAILKNIMGK